MTTRFNGFKLEELEQLREGLIILIEQQAWTDEASLNVILPELEQEIKSRTKVTDGLSRGDSA